MSTKKLRNLIFCVPFLVVLGLYTQVNNHEFVAFDDGQYTYDNPYVIDGLTVDGILWSVSDSRVSNYHPITWWSHMLDYELFGNHPGWMALENAWWHGINSVLVSLVMMRLLRSRSIAVWLGVVFASHPLLVEGVAWISQRKTVLSAFFFLLSVLLYFSCRDSDSVFRKSTLYVLSCLAYCFSLLSKSMFVTMPALIVLFEMAHNDGNYAGMYHGELSVRKIIPLLKRVIPYAILTAVFSFVAMWSQSEGGAVSSLDHVSIGLRLQTAFSGYLFYLKQFAFPQDLTFFYLLDVEVFVWRVIVSGLVILLVSLVLYHFAKKIGPIIFIGWVCFLVSLLPVIGLIQIGSQAYADRYMYGPILGLLMVFGGLIRYWFVGDGKRRMPSYWLGGLGVWTLLIMYGCYIQIGLWKNSTSLSFSPGEDMERNPHAIGLRALAYIELGDYERGKEYCEWVLRVTPGSVPALSALAACEYALGNIERAILVQEECVARGGDGAGRLLNLARYYVVGGRCDEARGVLKSVKESSDGFSVSDVRNLDTVRDLIREKCGPDDLGGVGSM